MCDCDCNIVNPNLQGCQRQNSGMCCKDKQEDNSSSAVHTANTATKQVGKGTGAHKTYQGGGPGLSGLSDM